MDNHLFSKKLNVKELTSTQILQQCNKNETLYTIFGFDNKYQLLKEGVPNDEVKHMQTAIENFFQITFIRPEPMPAFYNNKTKYLLMQLEETQIPSIKFNEKVCHYICCKFWFKNFVETFF